MRKTKGDRFEIVDHLDDSSIDKTIFGLYKAFFRFRMSAEPTRNDNAAGDETLVDRRDNPSQTLDQLSADLDSIHCEDVFTDTKLATIRRLKPVDRKGDHDASRPTLYIAETTIVSQLGPIPVQAPIDANSLEEAFLKFPEAIKTAVDDLSARAQEIRREEASRIVVPGTGAMPPAGGGAPGGGRLVY